MRRAREVTEVQRGKENRQKITSRTSLDEARGSRKMASLAATCPLATRAASGLRAPRSRAMRRCAQTTRAYGQTPSDQSGTNNVGKKSHLARSDRTAVVPRATSKGYGYGYGFEYGFKYGHGYGEPELGGKTGKTVAPSATSPSSSPSSSTTSGFKEWWAKAGKIDRSTIAALGGAALLSYGLISNIFYVSSLLGAMYSSCKIHAASPLVDKAAMQTFVTTYFGLWMIQNFLRPARMGLSVAISPFTDKIVEFFRRYVPGNRKPLAFGLTVFCVNVLGTFAYMFGGFFLITALTGVPLELGSLKSLLAAGKAEVAAKAIAKV